MPSTYLAAFTADATPPLGHPLCGGWIAPAKSIDDPLRVNGVVLLGEQAPVVLCAVDWCGLRNDANLAWREALARAAHTTPDRVAVQCVHPHDAPFPDLAAQRLLAAAGANACVDVPFFERTVKKVGEALQASLKKAAAVTHYGMGQARVQGVASNRRVLGPDGEVAFWRGSSCKDAAARAAPDGLIDPWLKVLAFWKDKTPLAALHFYACHPMSHYGQGRVSSDFCGLARQRRQDEQPGIRQIYFNGCGGNIAAGKYNDGAPANRPVLTERMHQGMKSAWQAIERRPLAKWSWRSDAIVFDPRREASFSREARASLLANGKAAASRRGNAAFQLAWLDRQARPVPLGCLHLDGAAVLVLPGEPFIEYQLFAQKQRPDLFVCTAGYGDGGPGYLPTREAYSEGGYEIGVALAGPSCEEKLQRAIRTLLKA
jgi:hypothetical protein